MAYLANSPHSLVDFEVVVRGQPLDGPIQRSILQDISRYTVTHNALLPHAAGWLLGAQCPAAAPVVDSLQVAEE